MKLPLSWLEQYIKLNCSIDDYISKMIMIGNGIEGAERLDEEIKNVVVGKIISVAKHPNADSLVICQVDVGNETVQIVTGAPNVKDGDYVPVALDGALLPGGKKIKSGKLRGEKSQGMLCSGPELNVPSELYPHCGEEGILIFAEPHTPGESVAGILGIAETVIDYEVLANRPDCLSVQGIARESAVALNLPSVEFPEYSVTEVDGNITEQLSVRIDDPALCSRYSARIVRGIKIGPSPMWMRKALNAAGIRPINNIVDITNYVMLETGQPMHAFDLKTVRGGEIIVRRATASETIKTLDGKERVLTENMLVIADKEGATAIAGVMGGEGSEITDDTKDVLFESACFLGSSVRQTSRALGLRTESSGRFERGVNGHGCLRALDRAVSLVMELDAGEVVSGVIDEFPGKQELCGVKVDPQYIRNITGVPVPDAEIQRILTSLYMNVAETGGALFVTPPDFRLDITSPADLAEEVLRVHGYDNIPSTLPVAMTASGIRGEKKTFERRLINLLCGAGYMEIRCYAFQSPKVFDLLQLSENDVRRTYIPVRNPLGEDYSAMRTTLSASMLNTIASNAHHGVDSVCFFELGSRYLPRELPIREVLPDEPLTLSLGAFGGGQDFYSLKGVIEILLKELGLYEKATFQRTSEPFLHPGRSAEILVDGNTIGYLGEAHPDALEAFQIPGRAYIAEIFADRLMTLLIPMGEAEQMAKVPAVQRDLALVMKAETPAGEVLNCIRESAGTLCEAVTIFDVYTGAQVAENHKSVAYSISLRAKDHTLTEDEIEAALKRALKACEKNFGTALRS